MIAPFATPTEESRTMSDLTDEQLREWAAEVAPFHRSVTEDSKRNGTSEMIGVKVADWYRGQRNTLAREVLALQERVAEMERVSRLDREELAAGAARIVHLRQEVGDLHLALAGEDAHAAALTRQRDEAVAVARWAMDELVEADRDSALQYGGKHEVSDDLLDARARLAALTGEGA